MDECRKQLLDLAINIYGYEHKIVVTLAKLLHEEEEEERLEALCEEWEEEEANRFF